MDKVIIPDNQIVPFNAIASNLYGLRIAFVNVFAVTHTDGSWTLIDAAIPFSASRIRHWAQERFATAPRAIILTHGHFDHVSAAGELAKEWDIPIYAHPLEFPYLTGEKQYPAPQPGVGGGLMSLLSPLYPRGPYNFSGRLQPLPIDSAGLAFAELPGWKVLHTPGHTPGHVSFYRAKDGTLIVGDAFCTTKPESFFEAALTQKPELHGPPAYFTSDWAAARASVQRLAALNPLTVAPGHGKPLGGSEVPARLRQLASDFDRIAVPESKKPTAA
ncbi:MAG: metallo-beta-lactamase family protein [Edaphobacter sp.]|nr:metallo-beta-lactamase family protein [Edaphobacter sp.]